MLRSGTTETRPKRKAAAFGAIMVMAGAKVGCRRRRRRSCYHRGDVSPTIRAQRVGVVAQAAPSLPGAGPGEPVEGRHPEDTHSSAPPTRVAARTDRALQVHRKVVMNWGAIAYGDFRVQRSTVPGRVPSGTPAGRGRTITRRSGSERVQMRIRARSGRPVPSRAGQLAIAARPGGSRLRRARELAIADVHDVAARTPGWPHRCHRVGFS